MTQVQSLLRIKKNEDENPDRETAERVARALEQAHGVSRLWVGQQG